MTTLPMGRFATAEPMNRTEPMGGVSRPMLQLSISMMPYWMGSMPMDLAMGSRMGVVIRMMGTYP